VSEVSPKCFWFYTVDCLKILHCEFLAVDALLKNILICSTKSSDSLEYCNSLRRAESFLQPQESAGIYIYIYIYIYVYIIYVTCFKHRL